MFITSKSYGEIINELIEGDYRKVMQVHPVTLQFVLWDSASIAGKTLGINPGTISAVCRGVLNQTGGYYWCYYDNFVRTINNTHYLKSYPDPNDDSIIKTQFRCSPLDFLPEYGNIKNYMEPCYILYFDEILRDVVGYENHYKVSNYSRVFNVKNFPYIFELKPEITEGNYRKVTLLKSGNETRKHYLTHRLSAIAFIPNPNNYPCVNHKDEDPSNNHISNLEWCTIDYNNKYGTRGFRCTKHFCKAVEQYDLISGKTIKEFHGVREAERQTNINQSHISEICRGERRSAGGYGFRFKEIDQ